MNGVCQCGIGFVGTYCNSHTKERTKGVSFIWILFIILIIIFILALIVAFIVFFIVLPILKKKKKEEDAQGEGDDD